MITPKKLALGIGGLIGVTLAVFLATPLPPSLSPTPPNLPVLRHEDLERVVQKVAEDCAQFPVGGGRVLVMVDGGGIRIGWPDGSFFDRDSESEVATSFRVCLSHRLEYELRALNAPLREAEGVFAVSWNHRGMPLLAYPLSQWSDHLVLKQLVDSRENIATRLAESLRAAGYGGCLLWYKFLDGYAVATCPEKVSSSGEPLFANEPARRFAADFSFGPTAAYELFAWWARRVFFTEKGYYQYFLFTWATGNAAEDVRPELSLEEHGKSQGMPSGEVPTFTASDANRGPLTLTGFVYAFSRTEPNVLAKPLRERIRFVDRQRAARIEVP